LRKTFAPANLFAAAFRDNDKLSAGDKFCVRDQPKSRVAPLLFTHSNNTHRCGTRRKYDRREEIYVVPLAENAPATPRLEDIGVLQRGLIGEWLSPSTIASASERGGWVRWRTSP